MTNDNKPKVLVLLAMFNGKAWIDDQLDSIITQADVSVSVSISDDNSTDNCPEIIEAKYQLGSELCLTSNLESSGSAGQNFFRLIRNCDYESFDYIAFSDQDDVWSSCKLFEGIGLLKESSASGYSSSALAVWPSGKEKLLTQVRECRNFDFLFEGAGQGCTFILKRDFFGQVQKFCLDHKEVTSRFYYHDWLVYIIARASDREWIFDERSFIRYRQHSANDTGARGTMSSVVSRLRLIWSGWYKSQVKVALEVSTLIVSKEAELDDFVELFGASDSLARRLSLMRFFVVNGRRKVADRLMLTVASLFGWL